MKKTDLDFSIQVKKINAKNTHSVQPNFQHTWNEDEYCTPMAKSKGIKWNEWLKTKGQNSEFE